MKWYIGILIFVSVGLLGVPASYADFPATAEYPPAAEDPVVDGAFSSPLEYANANKVRDDLDVGDFYKEYRQNWKVNDITYSDTITFFDNHYFDDPAYGQLDLYDMNSWKYKWGNTVVETWVFLADNHPDEPDVDGDNDAWWLDLSGIGSDNYPTGYNDDGGFLVRLNEDSSTDKIWNVGDPQPGDLAWDFADFYGVFAYGGFNDSAYTLGYSTVEEDREMYEWSITMNHIVDGLDGAIPGVLFDALDNPLAPGPCDGWWEEHTKLKEVSDWKPSMGGKGKLGGIGWVPDGTEWVLMGFDASMHPIPEPATICLLGLGGLLLRRRKHS